MSLAADLLPSVEDIAVHLYGEANPRTVRRIRHLIAKGDLPVKKTRGRIESRRSWIDALYERPDNGCAQI